MSALTIRDLSGLDGDRPRESLVKSTFAHPGWVWGDH